MITAKRSQWHQDVLLVNAAVYDAFLVNLVQRSKDLESCRGRLPLWQNTSSAAILVCLQGPPIGLLIRRHYNHDVFLLCCGDIQNLCTLLDRLSYVFQSVHNLHYIFSRFVLRFWYFVVVEDLLYDVGILSRLIHCFENITDPWLIDTAVHRILQTEVRFTSHWQLFRLWGTHFYL